MSTLSAQAASGSVDSTDLLDSRSVAPTAVQLKAVLALARVEAGRILLHPAYLATFVIILPLGGVGGYLTAVASGQFERTLLMELLLALFIFYLPMATIFPASLVASSARRAGTTELLDALPIGSTYRTTATLLASFGPAIIAAIAAIAIWQLSLGLPDYELEYPASLIAVPLLYVGISGLAVAGTMWLPWPGVPIAIVVGLFVWVVAATSSGSALAFLTAPWFVQSEADQVLIVAGYSDLWHTVYLLGLVALAWTAAILRERIRLMFLIGVPIGVVTFLAGWAQLP